MRSSGSSGCVPCTCRRYACHPYAGPTPPPKKNDAVLSRAWGMVLLDIYCMLLPVGGICYPTALSFFHTHFF